MGNLTKDKPKPMLKVKNKPMLQHIVEMAVKEGFEKIFISTHYLAEQIHDYFGDGSTFGADINYIFEEKPLGTGGSFARLPVEEGLCLVTNADIISGVGYSKLVDFHRLHGGAATMAVKQHIIQHPFGVVKADGVDLLEFEEKPIWKTNINAGIYVLDMHLKKLIKKNEVIDMPNLIARASKEYKDVKIFPLHESWIDLGDLEAYDNRC